MKCPEGHPCGVRNTKFRGVCSPLYCCQVEKAVRPDRTLKELLAPDMLEAGKRVPAADKLPKSETNHNESVDTLEDKARKEAKKLESMMRIRHEAIGFEGRKLQGADAEAWVSRRMVDLTPDAMAEIEWRLRNGNDTARADAARFILESQGHGKKDGPQIGQSPVLILTGIEVPWAKKVVSEASRVVEAEVVQNNHLPAQRAMPAHDIPDTVEPGDADA